MDAAVEDDVRLALTRVGADWRVVLERRGQRSELGGLDELIRFLLDLAAERPPVQRGLR
ncbi:MAG: hypothetical protein IT519_14580 [Burkholderiales bacterium]|nr:hypothetical protein [Burkholderiales bacterium]